MTLLWPPSELRAKMLSVLVMTCAVTDGRGYVRPSTQTWILTSLRRHWESPASELSFLMLSIIYLPLRCCCEAPTHLCSWVIFLGPNKTVTKNSRRELPRRFLWRFLPCHNPRLHSTTVRCRQIGEVNLVLPFCEDAEMRRSEPLTRRQQPRGIWLRNKKKCYSNFLAIHCLRTYTPYIHSGEWPAELTLCRANTAPRQALATPEVFRSYDY